MYLVLFVGVDRGVVGPLGRLARLAEHPCDERSVLVDELLRADEEVHLTGARVGHVNDERPTGEVGVRRRRGELAILCL